MSTPLTTRPGFERAGKFLAMQRVGDVTGHRAWWVWNRMKRVVIGRIEWLSDWKCYVYVPDAMTLYHDECLHSISEFLTRVTEEDEVRK